MDGIPAMPLLLITLGEEAALFCLNLKGIYCRKSEVIRTKVHIFSCARFSDNKPSVRQKKTGQPSTQVRNAGRPI